MSFRIQAGRPRNNAEFSSDDTKVSEAIETIFPHMTEDALLIWNNTYILIHRLNNAYDHAA